MVYSGFIECKYCAEKHLIEDTPRNGLCPDCGKPMNGTEPKELMPEKPPEITPQVSLNTEEDELILKINNIILRAKAARATPNRGKIIELCAKYLYKNEHFRTPDDTQILYHYNNKEGIYQNNGEVWVKTKIQHLLDKSIAPEITSIHVCNETVIMIKRLSSIAWEKLEPDIRYTPLANGIYDFTEDKLLAFTPDLFFTTKLEVSYDPTALCPMIDKFITEIVEPKNQRSLFELAGYIIRRNNHFQKAWILDGTGNNGKSVYIHLLEKMIGKENTCSIPIQKLESNRFSVAELEGKYVSSVADLSGADLKNTGMFKAIVGGDIIQAERKGQNPFRFRPWAKLIYSCNKIPDSGEDDSNAFYRRWIMITFPIDFSGREDRELEGKITTPGELSGFLNYAISTMKEVYNRGHFTGEETVENMRKLYMSKSNSVKSFLGYVENDPDAVVPKREVWRAYFMFCKEKNITVKSEQFFWRELKPIYDCDSRTTVDGIHGVPVVKGINLDKIGAYITWRSNQTKIEI